MGRLRGHAIVLLVCALAVAGAIVALVVVTRGDDSATPRLATTGQFAPLEIRRPVVPVLGGGIPVDLEPVIEPKYFGTALTILPGTHRYRLTISNASSLGVINSFQWYPPTATHIVRLLGSSKGTCTLRGLKGFGGAQFPTLVLHQSVFCDSLALKAPSCLCRGDGGALTLSFVTDKEYLAGDVDLRVRTAALALHPVRVR